MGKRNWKNSGRAHEVKFKRRKSCLIKFTGRISVSPSGFGFVKPEEEGADVFIPPRHLAGALDGDKVECALLDDQRDPERGPAGRVVAILEREREFVVGELIAGHLVRPLSKSLPEIKISGSAKGASRGDWVRLRLLSDGSKHTESLRGSVEEVYGRAGLVDADLKAVAAEFELCEPYSDEDNDEASKLPLQGIAREDFTNRLCATIDPADAKDFDDALSIADAAKPGEVELGVHIADVAAWVRANSKFDKEARRRSFSSYLPGMFMPMLPKKLTRLMSLTEGRVSPAHSVIFTVRESDGAIISSRRVHTNIKVGRRLNYGEVQDFIDGKPQESWPKDFAAAMARLVQLTRRMRAKRLADEEFIQLATVEIRVLCDEETKQIKGISKKVQRESDELVEDCMLAANSAVAAELIERCVPGLFRVHPEPTPEKLDEFSDFMQKAFGLHTGDLTVRKGCNEFLKAVPPDHRKPVILSAFLRSLPRAHYLAEPQIHFGLGKWKYSHFTSPIRRYPDLFVHQQLWAADTNGRLRSKKTLETLADECSAKEEKNDAAYFAANDRLKLHYLDEQGALQGGTVFEAVINKVSSAGITCEIPDLGIYGFVPSSSLHGKVRVSKKFGKARREGSHTDFKVGNFIYLQLDRLDLAKGSALFRPAGE